MEGRGNEKENILVLAWGLPSVRLNKRWPDFKDEIYGSDRNQPSSRVYLGSLGPKPVSEAVKGWGTQSKGRKSAWGGTHFGLLCVGL